MGRLTDGIKHLLIINILFFVATSLYGDRLFDWFALWYPQNPHFAWWQIGTHMFMHGGFMHIFFNMYALWAFGSPLERMWGTRKFLFFYFSAGLGAAFIHTGVNLYTVHQGVEALVNAGLAESDVLQLLMSGEAPRAWLELADPGKVQKMADTFYSPAVGASGAIYGILVAFGMSFPNSELFLIFLPVPIKAKYFIPVLIGLDLFSGVTGYSIFGAGIAHFAHVGGALFGFLMMWYWKRNQFNNNRWDL
ncbi:rhomboid family intramembrane serine protease [Robiginitalea sediminis]|uniref:rhomboid family intramembrane serine protease n=1 Tax=Robiginitalea sediminis TaxID=1982593 RepID=UPI000B4ACB42|nr:rhomboid family intramembrane serine protease [Robiginitalea sediminis]